MVKPASDTVFAGSVPALYDECLVPTLFTPYARDLVARAVACRPRRVLEIAAGTGVVTRLLAKALPHAEIVATDLNPGMLAVAAGRGTDGNVKFEVADAQDLDFAKGSFDLVLIQFGVMFFPDRVGAYSEIRRVLAADGTLYFNAWDAIEANPGSEAVQQAICGVLPEPKPSFLPRTPFGYHDADVIRDELAEAGFADIAVARVEERSPAGTGAVLARGYCIGSPVYGELMQHAPDLREKALAAAIAQAEAAEPEGGFPMSALVAMARG